MMSRKKEQSETAMQIEMARRHRRRIQKFFSEPSRTKQSFKDESDINNVMRRFEKTGVLEHVNRFQGRYGDFIDAPGYHQACNQVIEADAMFQSLPAGVRKRFQNDPAAFLEFMSDPANQEEAEALGLLPSRPAAAAAPSGGEAEPTTAAKPPGSSPGEGKGSAPEG